ncbi:MAG: helix-turn-helix transcriptional regulator [Polyangiaceae bacterium]|nr:helix-turn-helix transcriptional regulator [Polyangiaceae bacterium]NUQ74819.1 helix-turn-helix transcriptional regulator [Polyangiaceae bacterium]
MTNETFLITVGNEIRKRRQARGWTQVELAERSGLTPDCIVLIETGVEDPSVSAFYAIARSLDIPPKELLGPARDFRPEGMVVSTPSELMIQEIRRTVGAILSLFTKFRGD